MSAEETTTGAAFGQLLRYRRRASGLSQEELAERASVSVRTICDIERGQRSRPYRQTVAALAEALGLRGHQLDEFVRLSREGRRLVPDDGQPGAGESGSQAVPEAAGQQGAPPVPRQLPAAVSHFTGRMAELHALTQILDESGTATVVVCAVAGTAGVGKTATVVHWAHQVAERFPDGQLYVDLHGYDPGPQVTAATALARFLRDLGVPGSEIPAEEEERATLYRSLLARRRMLVVLDNAADVGQVRPLLPGTAGCAAVVTSRDSLAGLVARDGAGRLELDVLPIADAVRLLRVLIGARVDAEPEEAAVLARCCCRLPLGLRVAAELAAARTSASLSSLTAELTDQQHRLDLLDTGADPWTAVRAVFSWSIRHLDAEPARAFRLLGLHPGTDLDSRAAAALAGTTVKNAGHLLGQMRRAHLVQTASPDRYVMHDLLRDYARELAAAQDGEGEQRAAMTRLLDFYAYAAASAMDTLYPAERDSRPVVPASAVPVPVGPGDHGAARAWLDAERTNLAAAARLAADQHWPGHATALASTLHRYLERGGYYAEAVAIYGAARRAARSTADRVAEANALVNLAIVDGHQGRHQSAADQLQLALALFGEAGDEVGQARVVGNLGVIEFYQGRLTEAAGYLRQALALHHKFGDLVNEARMLGNLGTLNLRRGCHAQAKEQLDQAMRICKLTGNLTGEAHISNILGEVALMSGEYRQGARHLQHALSLSRQTGDRAEQARILCDLGRNELRQGRTAEATSYFDEAMQLSTEIGEQSVMADAFLGSGEVQLTAGRVDKARRLLSEAIQLAGQIREPHVLARAYDALGRASHAGGDIAAARQHWQKSLTLYADLGAPQAEQLRAQLAALTS